MKKLILLTGLLLSGLSSAQDNYFRGRTATEAKSWSVGLNSSDLSFSNKDKVDHINADLNAGYFIWDRVQAKIGVEADITIRPEDTSAIINYSAGVKYYAGNVFPLYLGWYGANGYNLKAIDHYLEVRAGYAYFLSEKISIEPSVGYLYSDRQANVFKFNFGINLFF